MIITLVVKKYRCMLEEENRLNHNIFIDPKFHSFHVTYLTSRCKDLEYRLMRTMNLSAGGYQNCDRHLHHLGLDEETEFDRRLDSLPVDFASRCFVDCCHRRSPQIANKVGFLSKKLQLRLKYPFHAVPLYITESTRKAIEKKGIYGGRVCRVYRSLCVASLECAKTQNLLVLLYYVAK